MYFSCYYYLLTGLFINKSETKINKDTTFIKNLNPSYVTGFCDGDACFTVYISKNPSARTGWIVRLAFSVHLNIRDLELLEKIKAFFGVGSIQINKDGSITYVVTSIKDLTNVITPHFEKYPLLTQKRADFELFRRLIKLMNLKEHLTTEGLYKIMSIRASINKGLTEELKTAFPEIVPVSRPEVKQPENIDINWFIGFVDAEGSFIVSVYKSKTTIGYAVKLIFSITQNQRDSRLLSSFVQFLNCGRVIENPKNSSVELLITKFSDLENKILPLFNKYPLSGIKQRDYEDFCKIALLIKHKVHLTNEGLEQINQIKSGMNRRRTR